MYFVERCHIHNPTHSVSNAVFEKITKRCGTYMTNIFDENMSNTFRNTYHDEICK